MDSYSSLFTSGLMALCETQPRSRPASHQSKDSASGLRSFLSLEMAESLRTLTNSSASPTSSRSNSLMPERRVRTTSTSSGPAQSALMTRRRSLPQPKPAPLAELPVLPTIRSRSNSESASPTAPVFDIPPAQTESKELAVPSSLKLELSSAPTTPGSRFPTTPTSSRAMSMLSPITSSDAPWLPSVDPTSPDAWVDSFLATLSPTVEQSLGIPTQPIEQSLGLQLPPHIPNIDALLDEHAPLPVAPVVPKMARARRPDRRNAPSRNTSVNANSMRSSQASVSTSYRRVQRGGALAKLEGREPRSQWMSDEEDGTASSRYQPGLSLMPSMEFKSTRSYAGVPENVKQQLVPFTTEDLNSSFIDLTDDIVSRRGISSFVS